MRVTLSDEARQYMAHFEAETGATVRDCLLQDDRVVFLVAAGDMGQAVGPRGQRVHAVEDDLSVDIDLVEDAETPEAFIENALAPAAVRGITISEQNDRVAYVEVPEGDRGIAIGSGGQNIETARTLAARHFDVDDIQLT